MEKVLAGSTCRSGGAVKGLQHAAQGVQAPGAQLLVVDAGVQRPGQLVAGLLHPRGDNEHGWIKDLQDQLQVVLSGLQACTMESHHQ